jgi:hypothetical protein
VGRPLLVGMSTVNDDSGVQGRVRRHVGGQRVQWCANRSGLAGSATLGGWLHSQAAMSDRQTVHSEQVEFAVPDVVNAAKDLV